MINESQNIRSCTFLNGHGDITIEWSDEDDIQMKRLIKKKMEDGYQFFIIKPKFCGIFGSKKTELKSVHDLCKNEIRILDKDVESFIKEAKGVKLLGSQGDASYDVISCAKNPEEVISSRTVATKPVRGG